VAAVPVSEEEARRRKKEPDDRHRRYSRESVEYLLKNQYGMYLKEVDKAARDCAAAVRRLVTKGPPLYLSDGNHGDAMPLVEGDERVDKFWFMDGGVEVSGKLEGAPEGQERESFWQAQRETLAAMEVAEAASKD
jgi:hypothetical protein